MRCSVYTVFSRVVSFAKIAENLLWALTSIMTFQQLTRFFPCDDDGAVLQSITSSRGSYVAYFFFEISNVVCFHSYICKYSVYFKYIICIYYIFNTYSLVCKHIFYCLYLRTCRRSAWVKLQYSAQEPSGIHVVMIYTCVVNEPRLYELRAQNIPKIKLIKNADCTRA